MKLRKEKGTFASFISQIEEKKPRKPVTNPNLIDIGSRVKLFPYSNSNEDGSRMEELFRRIGTVVYIRTSREIAEYDTLLNILVSWDNWDNGHDGGNAGRYTSVAREDIPYRSCYWVRMEQLRLIEGDI